MSRYIVQKFYSLLATTRQIYDILSSFPSAIIWSRTELITIEEKTTVTKNGWFVMGRIRVIPFVRQMVEFVATIFPFHYPSEIYSYHIVKNLGVIESVINHVERVIIFWYPFLDMIIIISDIGIIRNCSLLK